MQMCVGIRITSLLCLEKFPLQIISINTNNTPPSPQGKHGCHVFLSELCPTEEPEASQTEEPPAEKQPDTSETNV